MRVFEFVKKGVSYYEKEYLVKEIGGVYVMLERRVYVL